MNFPLKNDWSTYLAADYFSLSTVATVVAKTVATVLSSDAGVYIVILVENMETATKVEVVINYFL